MLPARACCAILAGAWLIGGGAPATRAAEASKEYTVTIENMQFSPQNLAVRTGDRVVWVNKDLFPHTATADAKAFDSSSIAAGASWTLVAQRAGVYSYGCSFHPTMKAQLTVSP
jgi:plastocyanin